MFVRCILENGYKITPAQLALAITPRTKWAIINSPNNPTGAVCNFAELRALGAVLTAHPDVHILTDDIYEHLIYDGDSHVSFAEANPSLLDRIVTVNGVSKTFAMIGWRKQPATPRQCARLPQFRR